MQRELRRIGEQLRASSADCVGEQLNPPS
jgi:hypothetical protein